MTFSLLIGAVVNEPSRTTMRESTFLNRLSENFLCDMSKTLGKRALSGNLGVRFRRQEVDNTLYGEIKFRPLFVSAEQMIEEIAMELPPFDAHGNHPARWRHACMKSYIPREDTPQKGRNAPEVAGKNVNFQVHNLGMLGVNHRKKEHSRVTTVTSMKTLLNPNK
jgi:hypothetical protein